VSHQAYPPLSARLWWYGLKPLELLVLNAMCRHCSDGSSCRAAVARYVAYSKLSKRKVQYILRALCKRGILTQLSKGIPARRLSGVYQTRRGSCRDASPNKQEPQEPRLKYESDNSSASTVALPKDDPRTVRPN
jgi:hypothetical protein